MIRRTVPALLLTLLVGTTACSNEGGEPAAGPGAGPATTTTIPVVTEGDATPPPPDPAPPVTAAPVTTPPASVAPSDDQPVPGDPADAVRAWIEAVAAGDTEAARSLTHVASRDRLGGEASFDAVDAARAEGYGAWAGSTDAEYSVVALPAAGPGVSIVVLEGTVAMEGGSARIVDAVPVRTDADGNHQVDPFQQLLGEVGIEYQAEPGSVLAPGHTFEVQLVAGRNVSLIVDDEVMLTTSVGADGDRQRITGSPNLGLVPGTHSFTVVVERDGAVEARSVLYTVG
jgi:hypothetical protein